MAYILIASALLLLTAFVSRYVSARVSQKVVGQAPYYVTKPLSKMEQVLYFRLVEALPDFIILAQVPLTSFISIRKNEHWQKQFNQISRKSVDYVICTKSFSVVAAIELDDSTHEREDRKKSDAIKDIVFKQLGIELLRVHPTQLPEVDALRSTFNVFLEHSQPFPA